MTFRAVTENIAITADLLAKLSLSQQHIDTIHKCSLHAEQVATLFEIISRRPDTAFRQFVDALNETGQNQVADFIVNYSIVTITSLPVELLELVLLRAFIRLFTDHYKSHYKTHKAVVAANSALAAVCYSWWQTVNGWPESTTRDWFRHRLRPSYIQSNSYNHKPLRNVH